MADRESEHSRKWLECGRERKRKFSRQKKIACISAVKIETELVAEINCFVSN